jgi:hypothetical protein
MCIRRDVQCLCIRMCIRRDVQCLCIRMCIRRDVQCLCIRRDVQCLCIRMCIRRDVQCLCIRRDVQCLCVVEGDNCNAARRAPIALHKAYAAPRPLPHFVLLVATACCTATLWHPPPHAYKALAFFVRAPTSTLPPCPSLASDTIKTKLKPLHIHCNVDAHTHHYNLRQREACEYVDTCVSRCRCLQRASSPH